MTAPALFSGHFFSALGWALAGLDLSLAKRPPAIRYALACAALATMLALPIATAWSLAAAGSADPPASIAGQSADAAAFSGLSGSRRAIAKGSLGYEHLSADDLVSMRIHGVTTEFARRVKEREPAVTVDELVSMRIHGRG